MTEAAQEAAAPANAQAPADNAPAEEAPSPVEEMSFDEFQSKLEAGEIDRDGNPVGDGAKKPEPKPDPKKPEAAAADDDEGERALRSAREAAREAKQKRARQAQQEQELATLRQQVQQAEEFQRRFKENPLKLAREVGMTPRQLSDLMMEEAGPDNELALANRRIEQLERRLEERDQQQQSAAKRHQISQFAEAVIQESSNDQLYPLLSEAPEPVVHSYVAAAIDHIADQGGDPRDYGKDELVALAEKLYSNSRRRKAAPAARQEPAPQNGNGKRAPKSVNTDMTTDFSQLPANFDELSPEEQEKALNMKFFGRP